MSKDQQKQVPGCPPPCPRPGLAYLAVVGNWGSSKRLGLQQLCQCFGQGPELLSA